MVLTLVLRDPHVCGIVVPGCMAAPAYMRIRRYRVLVIQISQPIKINVLSMFGSVAISNGKKRFAVISDTIIGFTGKSRDF